MPTRISSTRIADQCNQRIQGLTKYVSPNTEILSDGKTLKVADVTAIYQACLDARAALLAKRAELKAALNVSGAAEAAREAIDPDIRSWVLLKFGAKSQEAHEIGVQPRKVGKASVATKAQGLEQAAATRKARHTMGKKQRGEIKGTVPDLTPPGDPAKTAPPDPAPPAPQPTNGAAH
jgi:hypothetical protein